MAFPESQEPPPWAPGCRVSARGQSIFISPCPSPLSASPRQTGRNSGGSSADHQCKREPWARGPGLPGQTPAQRLLCHRGRRGVWGTGVPGEGVWTGAHASLEPPSLSLQTLPGVHSSHPPRGSPFLSAHPLPPTLPPSPRPASGPFCPSSVPAPHAHALLPVPVPPRRSQEDKSIMMEIPGTGPARTRCPTSGSY